MPRSLSVKKSPQGEGSILKILITNFDLSDYAGTQIVVRDLSLALLRAGHQPMVYSPKLGAVAEEIRKAGIVTTDRLDRLKTTPDIIHGHHHETLEALLHFPSVPAIYVCHGRLQHEESPFYFPRILRYVAVDQLCRNRIESVAAIPRNRIRLILNAVDMERFQPRQSLPRKPRRALVFSNGAASSTHLPAVRKACRETNLQLDVVGSASGNAVPNPEKIRPAYDIVFAKARCALEALATGNAVVLCDQMGLGGMVSSSNFDSFRMLNFGSGLLVNPLRAELIGAEIEKYSAGDARQVCERVRTQAGLAESTRSWIQLYSEVLEEFSRSTHDSNEEFRALAAYLEQWNYWHRLKWEREQLKKLGSLPVVGGAALGLARRVLRKWTAGWGLG